MGPHLGSLKLATMGALTPQKEANVTHQGSFCLIWLKSPCYNKRAGVQHIPLGLGQVEQLIIQRVAKMLPVGGLNRHWEPAKGKEKQGWFLLRPLSLLAGGHPLLVSSYGLPLCVSVS